MNKANLLSQIISQLENKYKKYQDLIYNIYKNKINLLDNFNNEEISEELNELAENINVLFSVVKNELEKTKLIKKNQEELNKLKQKSKKYDDEIIQLNKILKKAISTLKKENNIFKISSSNKNINHYNFQPRDLINLTIRINKNYKAPELMRNILPGNCLDPYPLEQVQMKASFLKFNLDENSRLKSPLIFPQGGVVKKMTILDVKYPENDKDVFFKFTYKQDYLPSYFSGELFDALTPPKIDKNVVFKVVACKFGFLDSPVKIVHFSVSDEETQEEMIIRDRVIFNRGAVRPEAYVRSNEIGFNRIDVNLDEDESSSHYTPGSMYQVSLHSLHRRESVYKDLDEDDGL